MDVGFVFLLYEHFIEIHIAEDMVEDILEEEVDDVVMDEGDSSLKSDNTGIDGIAKEPVSWIEAQDGLEKLKAYLLQNKMEKAVGDIESIEMEMVMKKFNTVQEQTHMYDFF